MIDGLHWPIATVFGLAAVLSLAVSVMLTVGLHEVRPEIVPQGRVLDLAYGAIRDVFVEPTTRRIFTIFGIAILARFMISPYLPILTGRINGSEAGLASAVALVVGTAALAGGLISPLGGAMGDRWGFRTVLILSMLGFGAVAAIMPMSSTVPVLAAFSALASAFSAVVGAMIFGLLAMDVPPAQRSATLNLVMLPLYLAGIVGPAIGAVVVTAGLAAVFLLAGVIGMLGALFVLMRLQRPEMKTEMEQVTE